MTILVNDTRVYDKSIFVYFLPRGAVVYDQGSELWGVFIDEDNRNVPMLMYADYIVIVGEIIGDVKQILDCLDMFPDGDWM